jgi:hypothetical protein
MRRIAKLEQCECDACFRNKQNEQAEQARQERGLAELQGTPKQIAWATTIREGVCKALDKVRKIADNDQEKAMVDGWEQDINKETSASWWIEHRYQMPSEINDERTLVYEFNLTFELTAKK